METIESGSTDLIITDTKSVYDATITALEQGINEPLYPGDERRIFGEALSFVLARLQGVYQDAAQQTMLQYARGEVLDALGARLGVIRLTGASSKCVLRYSLSSTLEFDVEIPKWSKVTADSNVYFATDETAIIKAGSEYVDVSASCTSIGKVGNDYGVDALTTMVDLIPYVEKVSNITTSSGGDEGETYSLDGDTRFRERIMLAPNRLSTAGPEQGYVYWAKTADAEIADVVAVSKTETIERELEVVASRAYLGGDLLIPETLVVDGGETEVSWEYKDGLLVIKLAAGAENTNIKISIERKMDCRVRVVPLMVGGELPNEDVLKAVFDAVNARDVRPMTDIVTVEAPKVVEYSIEMTYWTTPSEESECVAAIEGRGGAIERYVNEQCSLLGRDINPDVLKTMCMRPSWAEGLTGAVRCEITQPTYEIVDEDAVAQWDGMLEITHKVETEARWS